MKDAFLKDERGVISSEFTIIIAVVSIGALTALRILMPPIIDAFQRLANSLG